MSNATPISDERARELEERMMHLETTIAAQAQAAGHTQPTARAQYVTPLLLQGLSELGLIEVAPLPGGDGALGYTMTELGKALGTHRQARGYGQIFAPSQGSC